MSDKKTNIKQSLTFTTIVPVGWSSSSSLTVMTGFDLMTLRFLRDSSPTSSSSLGRRVPRSGCFPFPLSVFGFAASVGSESIGGPDITLGAGVASETGVVVGTGASDGATITMLVKKVLSEINTYHNGWPLGKTAVFPCMCL